MRRSRVRVTFPAPRKKVSFVYRQKGLFQFKFAENTDSTLIDKNYDEDIVQFAN